MRAAERIHPRREGQRLLRLVRAPHHDLAVARRGACRDLCGEPALADAGLPEQEDELPGAAPGLVERVLERGDLAVAADQRRLLCRRGERGRREQALGGGRCGGHRRGGGRGGCLVAQDFLVQGLGLGLGLGPELALERGDAELILAEGGGAATELLVESHQCPVHGLLERVERQELHRRVHGGLHVAALPLMGEQLGERLHGELSQSLPLAEEPFLEGWLREGEAGEEVAVIESRGPGERCGNRRLDVLFEGLSVDRHRGGVKGDGLPVGTQDIARRQGLAEGGQGLAQTRPRLGCAHVAPQQSGELVARMGTAGRQRQVGEQGLRLAGRQAEG